jgi:hypothetical protein
MAGGWSDRIGRLTENFISSNSRSHCPDESKLHESNENESTKFAVVAFGSQPGSPHRGRLIRQANPFRPIHCDAAEQIMFADMQITADGRFLEFNMGDWSMLLGGFTLIGLLVWLV